MNLKTRRSATVTLALALVAVGGAANSAAAAAGGLLAQVVGDTLTITSDAAVNDNFRISGPITSSNNTMVVSVATNVGQAVSPGPGCLAIGAGEVQCASSGFTRIAINSGAGDDSISLNTRVPAVVHGGDGQDKIHSQVGSHELHGDGGDDWVYAGSGNDRLFGEDGADTLYGGEGNDSLAGGNGDDTFETQLDEDGTDVLTGDAGKDRVDYSGRSGPVTVTLDGVANDGSPGENDAVAADIESASGGRGDDRLFGNDAANDLRGGSGGNDRIEGFGGDDFLAGYQGDDTLSGGDGNDEIWDGEGKDTVSGGGGDDRIASFDQYLPGKLTPDMYDGGAGRDTIDYSYRKAPVGVTVDLDGVANDGWEGENDNVVGIEWLMGSDGNDVLTGNAEANLIRGHAGNDVITGGPGKDHLEGGPGIDSLYSVDGVGNADYLRGAGFGDLENRENCTADTDDIVSGCNRWFVAPGPQRS